MPLVIQKTRFGDWADDAAYDATGGAAADILTGSSSPVTGTSPSSPTGPTYPGSARSPVGSSMPWAQLFTGMMGQGAGTTNAFTDATARLTQQQAEKQSTYRTFAIAGAAVIGVGFLAYAFIKR